MLYAEGVIVFFENAIAVNDINISVEEGEIVGVFGPNSSGKSTILNFISGLLLDIKRKEERRGGQRITIRGRIFFNGKDITHLWPHKRAKMGILLCREKDFVFPESSVEENLHIASFLLNKRKRKERIDFVYSVFPYLRSLRSEKAGLLSGGEQRMLSISMALIPNPKILLLDEPLFGLAPSLYEELLSSIIKLKEYTSILIAEQFALPVLPLIDRAYVIENGSLVFHGTKKELIENKILYSTYLT